MSVRWNGVLEMQRATLVFSRLRQSTAWQLPAVHVVICPRRRTTSAVNRRGDSMTKLRMLAALAFVAVVSTFAFAAKEACNGHVCNVQIKNANVQPACPPGVFTLADPTGCIPVGGRAVITWTGLNVAFCYINYTDPAAVTTNGIVTEVFLGVNGMLNGRFEHTPPWTEPAPAPFGLTYNITCRGLAQFNEQFSSVQKLTRIVLQ